MDPIAEVRAMIGIKTDPETGPDAVSREMIRHWCEAMEDPNPLYTNDEYASQTEYGGIIAPPTMMQTWSQPQLWPGGQSLRRQRVRAIGEGEKIDNYNLVKQKLRNVGYTGAMAGGTTMEYLKPVFPGDRITVVREFTEMSAEKNIGTRAGFFITFVFSYTNQHQEVVCKQSFVTFMFKNVKAE